MQKGQHACAGRPSARRLGGFVIGRSAMNPLFDEAIAFVSDTIGLFYSGRDIDRVVVRLTDDFSWIGAGEAEFSTDTVAIVSYMRERASIAPACEVFDEEFHLVSVSERSCTVMGRYRVRMYEESDFAMEECQRCSYELVDIAGELKIRHVHVSNFYQPMKDESYFPFEGGARSYEHLQQLVRDKTAAIDLLTHNIAGGLKMSDDDECYSLTYVNEGLARMLGYTIDELREVSGGTSVGLMYEPDRPQALADAARCFAQGSTYETEYRVRRKDGSLVWVLDSGRRMQADDGSPKIGSVLVDITSRKEAEIALALEQERYRIALRSVTDVLFEYDVEQDVLVEYERVPGSDEGAPPEERRYERYVEEVSEGSRIHCDDHRRVVGALQSSASVTLDVRRKLDGAPEGEWRWVRMHAMLLYDRNSNPVRAIGSWKDVTEERRHLEDLADQARRDPLTKLYNQSAVSEYIEPLVREGAARCTGALLVLDIDNFKCVNDTRGHLAGDKMLVGVARALEKALAGEEAVVVRVGGDEFVAFLPYVGRPQAREAAVRVSRRVQGLRTVPGCVTSSVGVALAGVDGDTYEALFSAADHALYQAKREGKNRVIFAGTASA